MVRFPDGAVREDDSHGLALLRELLERGIQTMVIVHNSKHWVRISVQIYNQLEDYQQFADAVLEIVRTNKQ
jgi:hypothetical protein